jgi:hypothetical protein
MAQYEKKIVHLLHWDNKFTPSFIYFTNREFSFDHHLFIVYGYNVVLDNTLAHNIIVIPRLLKSLCSISQHFRSANKIIIHGLFNTELLLLLFINLKFLKSAYWTIWGGDLYIYNTQKRDIRWYFKEIFRKFIIRRIGHLVTHVKGDLKLVEDWYGGKGEQHDCFMYQSNIFKDVTTKINPHDEIFVLIGNSADPSNNHIEVLKILERFKSQKIKLFCPLSYGCQSYAQRVSDLGKAIFGDKFIPIRDFMSLQKYNELLCSIDIAIFNHRRQQAFGNIITLLGMKKKVFLRHDVTTFSFFDDIGVAVYSIDDISLDLIDPLVASRNSKLIINNFSESRLVEQWSLIYE